MKREGEGEVVCFKAKKKKKTHPLEIMRWGGKVHEGVLTVEKHVKKTETRF